MKTPEDDVYLGRHVLEHNLVSREALLECLFQIAQERSSGMPRPLGVVLVSRGLITQEELDRILSSRVSDGDAAATLTEAEVGRLLVSAGLLSQENVEECLRLQDELRRAGREAPPLGELVVHRGYVTDAQVLRVLAYQRKALYSCSGCGVRVSAAPPPAGNRYRCKKCGGSLAPLEPPSQQPAPGAMAMREAEHGEDSQHEVDRAVAVYLKQKGMVRRDLVRACQRLQTEFARYGLVTPLAEVLRRAGAISWPQQRELEGVNFDKLVRDPDWKKQAIPGYKLLARLASGGFAGIWTAESLFGGGQVAAKLLHPERAKDPRAVARFEWEAMLLQRFSCPSIVRGIDRGFERGTHYLIMEHVDGRSLGQALSESGAFPVREALRAARQVAEALAYLHGEGYLHRDVKPDNAILDSSGRLKLCDLGFAVPIPRVDGQPSQSATAVGTAGYMPPEMARGVKVLKEGGDIYSLGILLYALLTGHEPFAGVSSEEVVTDQIEGGLPVPNLMMVSAPAPVIQLLKRMMHPDPARRVSRAADVIAAIDQLMN